MRILFLLVCLMLPAAPARAETPWAAAEAIRSEAARIERLLYRPATPERRAEIDVRLRRMAESWRLVAAEFGPQAAAVEDTLQAHAASAATGDAAATARLRQRLWAALLGAARTQTLAAVEAGDAKAATNWLSIREYARASGDTAAALAVQALGRGEVDPQTARATVEAELLTVAASELRLALTRAVEDAAAGHAIQYAGDLGRAAGLIDYLHGDLAARLGAAGAAALSQALSRAETNPAALAQLAAQLAGYTPVALSPEERLRRARLLRRFTAMVWEEYGDGVRGGEISQPIEYHEALLFRDRAALILGDLAPGMPAPAATRLAALLSEMKAAMEARADGVEARVAEALSLIDASFGAAVEQGGYSLAVEALPAALDDLAKLAAAGDWGGAELKRLEAYAWFDPDIEQRLVPRSPAMALRIEARFWEGGADRPGLGRLVADRAPAARFTAEVGGIKADLAEARARIEAPLLTGSALVQSMAIILREGIEAALVLAALLAALRIEGAEPARFRRPIGLGVAAALAASFALWAGTRWLFSISTLDREALEGGTALLAAAVLIWIVSGFAARSGHVAAMRRRLAAGANAATVGALAFLVVFREGFETVLFYEALLVDAAPAPVLAGLAAGAGIVLAASWLVLASGRRLPFALIFRTTAALLAVLAVMLVGAGIRGLQTAALISATPVGWFPDRDWLQLWFGLFPLAEPLLAQALVLLLLTALALRSSSGTRAPPPQVLPSTSRPSIRHADRRGPPPESTSA